MTMKMQKIMTMNQPIISKDEEIRALRKLVEDLRQQLAKALTVMAEGKTKP